MKTKFILALALSVSFASTAMVDVYASQNENITGIQTESKQKNDKREYIFDVIKVDDSKVELMYNGEITEDAIIFEDILGNSNITLDKALFDKDVKVKDRYIVKSMDRIWAIDTTNIKKEDIILDKKYEKPQNMDLKDVPKDATVKDFSIESINEDPVSTSAVLSEVGNPDNKYSISLDRLPDENPMVGYMYKIYWDGISLESYPAQFGKIYRVENVLLTTHEDNKEEDDKKEQKKEFEVTEVHETGVTLAEVGNKENLYNISFKDLKDDKPVVGDRYMITWSGMSTKSYPAQFIDIKDVEKWVKKGGKQSEINKEELKKAIAEADKTTTVNGSFTKESVKAFEDAKAMAKDVEAKKDASQKEIDDATKKLNEAITGLKALNDKNMETSKIYEVIEIQEDEKQVILKEKDSELTYMLSIKELNDKDVKVGDRYEIKTNGIILPSNPAQFGKVLDVAKIEYNKTVDKSDLNKTIMDADKIIFGDASYKEETVDNFHKANEQAKKVYENKEASQKEVDEANKNLMDAIKNLAEKDGVIKKKFVLKEIIEKGGKKAVLQSVDYPDKEFTVNLDALNDKNPQVNDYYMVTIEMVDPEAEPFEMGEITKIEKIMEEEKPAKKEEKKVEAPKADKKIGFGNPKTGIAPVAPLVGVIAGAATLLKKKFN